MENQNNNRPNGQNERPEGDGNNNRNRNNRHRHYHKPRRPHNNNSAEQDNAAVNTPAEQAKETVTQAAQKPSHPQNQKKHNPPAEGSANDQAANNKNQNGQNKSRNDKRRNDRRSRNRGNERGPYNPYEEVPADELSLAELRARIVVKSADESANAAPSSPFVPSFGISTAAQPAEPQEEINVDHILNPQQSQDSDEPVELVEIVGIRFRASGKMYYFDPQGIKAKRGQHAIVETARGPEFGDVCLSNSMVNVKHTFAPLRPLLRIATDEDIAKNEENHRKEKEALHICKERIAAHRLDMKLVDVQYAFDNSKLLFYFTSDGRVDFRELVKDLASVFRTRIELRQIGIRDESKMLGGLGVCGRAICCSTFLPDFAQVCIKMAKEQNLSLNANKISGVCGRLMCCLRFESDVYSEELKKTPAVDSYVKTEDGVGQVISVNPLAGTVRVIYKDKPDQPPKQFHRNEVTVVERERRMSAEKPKED